MIFSLAQSCIEVIIQKCSYEVILSLFSVEFPNATTDFMLSLFPLDYVFKFEKESNCNFNANRFWRHLIAQCSFRNHIFVAKLNASIDIFELEKFLLQDSSHLLKHQRQSLINALFLEALEKLHFTEKRPRAPFGLLPLHSALRENSPSVSILEWLMLLSSEINSFNYYRHDTELLLKYEDLCKNIANHAIYLNLKFRAIVVDNIKQTQSLANVYTVLCSMLSQNCIKRVSFGCVCNSLELTKLLDLCNGKVSEESLQISNHVSGKASIDVIENSDIWDDAVGQHYKISAKHDFLEFSVADDCIYSEFENPDLLTFNQSTSSGNCVVKFSAISELELDIDAIRFENVDLVNDESSLLDSLASLVSLNKLALNNFSTFLENEYYVCNKQVFMLTALKKLLIKPTCKLRVLKLSRFIISNDSLKMLYDILLAALEQRNFAFDELALINCRFCEIDSLINKKVFPVPKALLKTFYLESADFLTAETYSYFLGFFCSICPTTLCVLGSCHYNDELHNISILRDVLNCPRIAEKHCIEGCVFELPEHHETTFTDEFCNALLNVNLKSFCVIHHSVLPQIMYATVENHAEQARFIRSSTTKSSCDHSMADYLSQM